MKIVVTGGTGFLGRHLVPRLKALPDHDVRALEVSDYDLTRRDAVAAMYRQQSPDLVVHLAAVVGGIGANRRNPGRFFHDNMAMGLHVVEEARRHGTSRLILVGTICSYPKFTPVPFREEDLWSGYPEETNAPYGIAKKALLVMGQAYREQYGMDIAYYLPVNLFGPGDHFDLEDSHVIPALVRKFVEAKDGDAREVGIWGTGNATREFLYVEDCAEALTLAVRKPSPPEPVNLGAGFEISIADLARTIAEEVGFTGDLRFDPSMPDGQPRRSLNTSRAERYLGWKASTPIAEGIRKTIEWFRAHPGGA